MRKNSLLAAAAAVILGAGASAPVMAEGWYTSLTGGTAKTDLSRSDLDALYTDAVSAAAAPLGYTLNSLDSEFDRNDLSWGVDVGYEWGSHFAVEVGYVELGTAEYTADYVLTGTGPATFGGIDTSFRINGPTIGAVGILPIGQRFEVHARGGILFSRARVTERATDANGVVVSGVRIGGSDKDLFAGVGAGWNITPDYSLRVDFRRFLDAGDEDSTGESDIDQITLSVQFR